MIQRRPQWPWQLARLVILIACLLSLYAALVLVGVARYDGDLHQIDPQDLLVCAATGALAFGAVSVALRLHQGRYAVGSAEEFKTLAVAVVVAALAVVIVDLAAGSPRLIPLSVPLVAAPVWMVMMLAFRLAIRIQREGGVRPRTGQRTLVFGAGNAGDQLIRSMLGSTDSPYLPVGLLDDDPSKRHARIRGVRMLGSREQL